MPYCHELAGNLPPSRRSGHSAHQTGYPRSRSDLGPPAGRNGSSRGYTRYVRLQAVTSMTLSATVIRAQRQIAHLQ